MPIYFGDNILSKINLGSGNIKEAYLGDIKVFGNTQLTTLTFESRSSNASDVVIKNNLGITLKYSTNDGSTWTDLASGSSTPAAAKVIIMGAIDQTGAYFYSKTLGVSGTNVAVSGRLLNNVCYNFLFFGQAALKYADGLIGATNLTECCYQGMFWYCTSLTTPPQLPATVMAPWCYYGMFQSCTSLTTPPTLPATTLADYCYSGMFNNCTSLTTPPQLPATTLADYCYYSMFNNCTSLTTPPQLPATTLAKSCYYQMFHSCTSLTTPPQLPATTLAEGCYYQMFQSCSGIVWGTTGTPYRLPTEGTGTTATKWNIDMFKGNSGTLPGGTGTPAINTTYYYTATTDNTQKGEGDV